MKHVTGIRRFLKTPTSALQYTYVTTLGNKVYGRYRDASGAPVYTQTDYSPIYYIPAPDVASATHHGYDGTPLIPHMVDTLNETRGFFNECESRGIPVFGNIQPEYMMLSDIYGQADVPCDSERLYVWNIDIEVGRDSERGHARVEDPFCPVTAITVIWHHMGNTGTVVYSTGDYTSTGDELYIKCRNEEELLLTFLDDFKAGHDYPDIVTGWNVQFYDIPYLVNRMKLLFTESTWVHMSPFERLADRRVTLNGKDQTVIDIRGITILDYLELYRKFTFSQQESYRLDHIAHVELGKRKMSYVEYRSLQRLYETNFTDFIRYNITDVKLVDELDAKLKLIDLVCALAYGAKSNFVDTFRQVRLWDIMIYHRLRGLGAQIPPRKDEDKTEQYQGAYVKDPIVGEHSWVVSFDVASMYPAIIREWNLSPEMIASRESVGKWSVDDLLQDKVDTDLWVGPVCANDFALAANGLQTRQDTGGIFPVMLGEMFNHRIEVKGAMKKIKKELTLVDNELARRQMQ